MKLMMHFDNKTIINNKWHIDNGLEIKAGKCSNAVF